jgi:hypothetical protein
VSDYGAAFIVRDQCDHFRSAHLRRSAAEAAVKGRRGWVIEVVPDALTPRAAARLVRLDDLYDLTPGKV